MTPLLRPSAFALSVGLAAAPVLAAAPQGATHELHVIEPIGTYALATSDVSDVNDHGLVIGRNTIHGNQVPFNWTASAGFGTPVNLPAPNSAPRINNVGDSVAPGSPYLALANGTLVPIPYPLGGQSFGATDLNDSLRLIGQGAPTGTSSGLFTWTPQGGSVTVPIPSGSALRRVNANGLAAGHRLINGTGEKAFVVDLETFAWVDLHALLGNTGASEAFDVNDAGTVVGFGPDGVSLSAWVWSQATGFTFLPGLLGGETMRVLPRAIDERGRVVGSARTGAGDFHAFLWDPSTGMVDLNSLVQGGTFTLVEATDISETGVIIGRGFHGTWGPSRGFILVEPSLASPYCTAAANSTGSTGAIFALNIDLAERSLVLAATGLPPTANAMSLASRAPAFVANPAGSAGNLCLGGAIGRLVGGAVLAASSAGTLSEPADLDALPQPNGPVAVQPGETWHFQYWFRDAGPSGPTSNFTNAVSVQFP